MPVKAKFTDRPEFFCEICKKQLANAKTLRAHLLTKTHSKNASERNSDRVQDNLSQQEFEKQFGDRILSDLVKDDQIDAHFDINEIEPWLGLGKEDIIALVRKIFHETLERSKQSAFEPQSFCLNQFKKLLIASRTRQSGDSFDFMKAIRSARREKR